ncbi:hypothetical protein WR25_11780 isoform B [Diploscapter pachys]|uniref:RRM domain-containing protein n=1 Tax=Diploscapter pachys TaxID=2018661 RepID=A0A2A2J9G7_9BILA|nr:hypothetical protein WR25_11780 isoform B [Diploscapter pachys]
MSSRLIVKNLPSNTTEASLRKAFNKFGSLSDVSLKYTKEGKFRKFAFVGFLDEETAVQAKQHMHSSFIGTARITVEECLPFGDANKPRSWSRYSKDSSAYTKEHPDSEGPSQSAAKTAQKEDESAKQKGKTNKKLEKFLEVKGIKKDEEAEPESPPEVNKSDVTLLNELLEGIVGDTNLSLIFTGLPTSIKQKSIKEWLMPVRMKAAKIARNTSSAAAFVSFSRSADARRAQQRDGQFIGGYKVSIQKVPSQNGDSDRGDEEDDKTIDKKAAAETEEARIREEILDTGRLFLRNLPFEVKEEDIRFAFKQFGEITDVQVIIDKKTGRCKGYAIVEFMFPESAVAAYGAWDGKVFKGRMLHILSGAEKRPQGGEQKDKPDSKNFKQQREEALKSTAMQKAHSWNTLFLGANAVAETIADKLGVTKADILLGEKSGESAGVRLALAETRLVRETRDFLLENGVKLDAFSKPSTQRSKTVIVVKNLPAKTEEEELRRLFERHGTIEKFLLPPNGVSALVAMSNEVDAKKAFTTLAYSRFHTQPLYLEWAPIDTFNDKHKNEGKRKKQQSAETTEIEEPPKKRNKEMTYEEKMEKKRKKKEQSNQNAESQPIENEEEMNADNEMKNEEDNDVESTGKEVEDQNEAEGGEQDDVEEGAAVFVKNLAFDTTDEALQKLFSKNYRIQSAQVAKKLNPADPTKSLSMGFGFVQFYTEAEAKRAIKEMQGELLDGHSIELKQSNRAVVDPKAGKRKAVERTKQGKCTKVLVRNIPFEVGYLFLIIENRN